MRLLVRIALALAVIVCLRISIIGQAPALHVLKIAAGPAGSQSKDAFVLTEERSTFNRSDDKEVIVLFQWDGVPGPHKLDARWRSPDGSFTSNSVVDYVAKDRRFGAYWRIATTPTMALGTWSIEATVDGQPGGRFTFEITDTKVTPGVAPKRPLLQQELYERLSASFVLLTRATEAGREMDAAGAVAGDEGQLFTAVKVLDEASRVQAVSANGTTQPLTQVVDLERAGGWAILAARVERPKLLPRASEPPRVGDRCYSMQGNPTGARVLLEGQVTGKTQDATGGLMVSFFNGAGTYGSPVVNEFGELVGLLGSSAMPPHRSLRLSAGTVEFGNIPMIPIDAVKSRPGASVSTFETLRARGDLLEPLVRDTHVLSGGFATNISRSPMVRPEDQRVEFSGADKEIVIFVTWSPRDRLKGQTMFRVYDAANRLVAASKAAKVDFRKNELVMSSWRIPVFAQAGTYRAEIHLDGKPAWRDYVRVVR
jgi:S1-C subfamily serine protease